jgi:hypothetical protein
MFIGVPSIRIRMQLFTIGIVVHITMIENRYVQIGSAYQS